MLHWCQHLHPLATTGGSAVVLQCLCVGARGQVCAKDDADDATGWGDEDVTTYVYAAGGQ